MKVKWRTELRSCMHSLAIPQTVYNRYNRGSGVMTESRHRYVWYAQPCVMKEHRKNDKGKSIHQTAAKQEWS